MDWHLPLSLSGCKVVISPLTIKASPTMKTRLMSTNKITIGITGGHGVGKTTFCRALLPMVELNTSSSVELLEGLGDHARRRGIIVGSSANEESVLAIVAAHVERERKAMSIVTIYDRCLADALAYTRALKVTQPSATYLIEEVAYSGLDKLDFLIHLRLSEAFLSKRKEHETESFRMSVELELNRIFDEHAGNKIRLDAADASSLLQALDLIREKIG